MNQILVVSIHIERITLLFGNNIVSVSVSLKIDLKTHTNKLALTTSVRPPELIIPESTDPRGAISMTDLITMTYFDNLFQNSDSDQ